MQAAAADGACYRWKKACILDFFQQKRELHDFGTFPVSHNDSKDTNKFVLTSNT